MFLHLLHRSSSSTSDCVDVMELPNLHRLSYFKDIERLNELLRKEGIDIDKRDGNGRTALHYGCLAGSTKVIEALLDRSPEMHLKTDSSGRSPGYLAIQHGRLDCVELLAKRGHNFDEKDSNGITPLHVAISENESAISEFLIKEALVHVDEADHSQVTPLHTAVSNGLTEVTKILIEYGANINALDCYGRTPLILAAAGGEEGCVISLIEKGAKPMIKDFRGLNAKDWASKKSHQSIYSQLVEAFKDRNNDAGNIKESHDGDSINANRQHYASDVHHRLTIEADVENSSSGYEFEGQLSILKLLSLESNSEVQSSDGEGYGYLPSESMQLLLADQSETKCEIENISSDVPDRNGMDAQDHSQQQNEIPSDDGGNKAADTPKARFVSRKEVVDVIAANESPTVEGDLADSIQQSNLKTVELQSDAQNVEKSRKDETSIIGPSEIANIGNIAIEESEMPQRKEILLCIDQISSATMASTNDTDDDEYRYGRQTPASQGTYTSESEEFTMDISRFYRLSGQISSNTSSADGHRFVCDSKTSTQNSTDQETRFSFFEAKNHREYILKNGLNAKLNTDGVGSPKQSQFSGPESKPIAKMGAFDSLQGPGIRLKRTTSNIEIRRAKVEHQIMLATVANEKCLELSKQRVGELERKLEKERKITKLKDSKIKVLRNIYRSMVGITGDEGIGTRKTSDSKTSEGPSIIVASDKQEVESNLLSEVGREGRQMKTSYVAMKGELEKKIEDLTFSNEYYENKVITINHECFKERNEINKLKEHNENFNQEMKDDAKKGVFDNGITYAAKVDFRGKLPTSRVLQNRTKKAKSPSLLAQTTDSLILARQNSLKKVAEDVKGKLFKKVKFMQDEFLQVMHDLMEQKIEAPKISLHDELRNRFVACCENLQQELGSPKENYLPENMQSCLKEGSKIGGMTFDYRTKYDTTIEEQKRIIGELKECISETQQKQRSFMKLFIDAQQKEEMHGEVIGSSLILEEALAKSYEKISYLEECLSTLKVDNGRIFMTNDSTRRRDIQKSEPKQSTSKKGKYDNSTYSEQELEMMQAQNREQLIAIENLSAKGEKAVSESPELQLGTSALQGNNETSIQDARLQEQGSESVSARETGNGNGLLEENRELVRDLWKTRLLLEKADCDNTLLQEEYRALALKFEVARAKVQKNERNNDSMMSMEDVLEENATLMNLNAEVTGKYNQLLTKLRENDESSTLNGDYIEKISGSKEPAERKLNSNPQVGETANSSGARPRTDQQQYSLGDANHEHTSYHSGSTIPISRRHKKPKLAQKHVHMYPDIRLSELINAMNSDTDDEEEEDDIIACQSEVAKHAGRSLALISENGDQEGTLLIELNQLTKTNLSLKEKIRFLEKWSDGLNEEIHRLQAEVKAVGVERDLMQGQFRTRVENLQEEIKILKDKGVNVEINGQCLSRNSEPCPDSVGRDKVLKVMNVELTTLRKSYESLQNKAEEWNQTLSDKISRLQEYLKDANAENCLLKHENEEIKLKLNKATFDLDKTKELGIENDAILTVATADKVRGNVKLLNENDILAKDCKASLIQNRILGNDNDVLSGRNIQLKQMLRLASITLGQLVEDVLQSRHEILELKNQLSRCQAPDVGNEKLMVDKEVMKSELNVSGEENANGDFQDLGQSRNCKATSESDRQRLEFKLNDHEERISELLKELNDAKVQLAQANYHCKEIAAQEAENNKLKEKLELVGNSNANTLVQNRELLVENANLIDAIVQMKEKIVVLKDENESLESELDRALNERNSAQESLYRLQEDSCQCVAEKSSLQATYERLEEENSELKKVIDGMKLHQRANRTYILELEKECEVLSQEKTTSADVALLNQLEELRRQCTSFEAMLEENEELKVALTEEKDRLRSSLQGVKALRLEHEKVQKEQKLLRKQHDTLQAKNVILERDLKTSTERKKGQSVYIMALENEIEVMLKEAEEMKSYSNALGGENFNTLAGGPSTEYPNNLAVAGATLGNGKDYKGIVQEICAVIRKRQAKFASSVGEKPTTIKGWENVESSTGEIASDIMESVKEVIDTLFDEVEFMAAKLKFVGERCGEFEGAGEQTQKERKETKFALDGMQQETVTRDEMELKEIVFLLRERLNNADESVRVRVTKADKSFYCGEHGNSEITNRDIEEVNIKGIINLIFDEIERLTAEKTESEMVLEKLDALAAENNKLKQYGSDITLKEKEIEELRGENDRLMSDVEIMSRSAKESERILVQLNSLSVENLALKQIEVKLNVKEKECLDLQNEKKAMMKMLGELKTEFASVKEKLDESRSDAKYAGDVLADMYVYLNVKIFSNDSIFARKVREILGGNVIVDKNDAKYNKVKETMGVIFTEGEKQAIEMKTMEKTVNSFGKLKEELDYVNLENAQLKDTESKLRVKEMENSNLLQNEKVMVAENDMLKKDLDNMKGRCNALEKAEGELIEIQMLVSKYLIENQENDSFRKIVNLNKFEQPDADTFGSNLKDIIEVLFNELSRLCLKIDLAEEKYKDYQEMKKRLDIHVKDKLRFEQINDKLKFKEEECAYLNSRLLDLDRDSEGIRSELKSLQQKMKAAKEVERKLLEIQTLVKKRLSENDEVLKKKINHGEGCANLKEMINIILDENRRLSCDASLMQENLRSRDELQEKLDAALSENEELKRRECESKRNRNHCLEKAIAVVTKEYDEVKEELDRAMDKVKENEKLQMEHDILAKECRASLTQNRILGNDNEVLSGRNVQLKQMLKSASATLEKLAGDFMQSENAVSSLKKQLKEFQACRIERENLAREKEWLTAELETYKDEMVRRESEIVTFTSDIKKMNAIIQKKDEDATQASADYNEKIEWLSGEKKMFGNAVEEQQKWIDTFHKQKSQLENDLVLLQSRVEEIEKEKTEVRKCLEKEMKRKDEIKAENELLVRKYEDMKSELLFCEERSASSEKDLKKATDILKKLANERKTLSHSKDNFAVQISDLQEQLKKFQAQKAELENINLQLKGDLRSLSSEVIIWKSQHENISLLKGPPLVTQSQNSFEEFEQLKGNFIDLDAKYSEIKAELRRVQRNFDHSEKRNSKIMKENNTMRLKIQMMESQLENAKVELDVAQLNNNELSSSFESANSSFYGVSDACIGQEKIRIDEDFDKNSGQNNSLTEKTTQGKPNQAVIHSGKHQLLKGPQDSQRLSKDIEAENSQLKEEPSLQFDATKRHDLERDAYELKLNETSMRMVTLEKDIEEQNRAISDKEEEYFELMSHYNMLKEEKRDIEQKFSVSNKSLQKHQVKLKEHETLNSSLEMKVSHLSETIDNLQESNTKLNRLYSECLRENEALSKFASLLEDELTSHDQREDFSVKYRDARRELKRLEWNHTRDNTLQSESPMSSYLELSLTEPTQKAQSTQARAMKHETWRAEPDKIRQDGNKAGLKTRTFKQSFS